jgi:hypothetical protein
MKKPGIPHAYPRAAFFVTQNFVNARTKDRPAEHPVVCPIDLPCVAVTSAKFGLRAANSKLILYNEE